MKAKKRTWKTTAQAISFIQDGIDTDKFPRIVKLPSIKRLARMADVSPVTMGKAVRYAHEHNMLDLSAGQSNIPNYFEQTSRAEEIDAKTIKWEMVAEMIRRDIITGAFQSRQNLPSAKQLQAQYHVSYRTLKKALNYLFKQNIIQPHKRGYAVVQSLAARSNMRLVMLIPHYAYSASVMDRLLDYMKLVDIEAAHANLDIQIVLVEGPDKSPWLKFANAKNQQQSGLPRDKLVLGYLAIRGEEYHEKLLPQLTLTGKPVAVIVESADFPMPEHIIRHKKTRFFHVGVSKKSGEKIGAYLLQKAHYNVAYFSPYHTASWSQLRLKGLQSVYRDAGFADGIKPFVFYIPDVNTQEQKRLGLVDFNEKLSDMIRALPQPYREALTALNARAQEQIWEAEIIKQLKKHMQKALRDKSITAWIAANDYIGHMMIEFLEQQGIPVPGGLSVISFDDNLLSLDKRLTTYNFNLPAVINSVITFLLGRDRAIPQQKGNVIEVDGIIIERQTINPVQPQSGVR